jgi:integrase
MASRLTDAIVRALPAPAKASRIYYDAQVKGFGVRVTAGASRAFILNYRTRHGRERRFTNGNFPDWRTTAARAEATELKKLIDRGGDPLGDVEAGRIAPTVADLCDRFIAEYLPRKRASTAKSYQQIIEAEIRRPLGRRKVAEIHFADIDGLHREISKRAPYRANRVVAVLSRMFSLAIKWEWRTDNPCRGVERNDEVKRYRYLSGDELARLLDVLAERTGQSTDAIRMLLMTGARRGEVLAARWDDFDFEKGIWSKPASAVKTRREHHVPLSAPALALLSKLREQAESDAQWLFPAADGGHRKDLKDAWISICRDAKIVGLRVHDLRHSFASQLASGGASLPLIGALLGHSSPATTQRYAHLFPDVRRAAMERVGAIISGSPSAEVIELPLKGGRK